MMSENFGISLKGRKMLYHPWIALDEWNSLSRKKKELFTQPGKPIVRIIKAFQDEGGDVEELSILLNDHVPNSDYDLSSAELFSVERYYSLEYYFYILQFTKLLLENEGFPYVIDEEPQLDKCHNIIEQGPMRFKPWLTGNIENQKEYFSITNIKAFFSYVENSLPRPPFSPEADKNPGQNISRLSLACLNHLVLAEDRIKRSFIDRIGILVSLEFILYSASIFEMLTNDSKFNFHAMYYGFKNSNLLAKAVFLQPTLSPIEGFRQWTDSSSNLYNLQIIERGRTLRIKFDLHDFLQSKMCSIYQAFAINKCMQGNSAASLAFIEHATGRPAKMKTPVKKADQDFFNVIIRLKSPYKTAKAYPIAAGAGLAAVFFFLIVTRLFLPGTASIINMGFGTLIIIGLTILSIQRKAKLTTIKNKFTESKKLIDDQLDSLNKSAKDLLQERNSLERKVKERTEKLNEALEQLKALDKAKTNFIANVSHELRTPLTLLSVPLEGVQQDRYGQNIPSQHPVFSIMRRNVDRLRNQISQLLDFARLDLDTIPFKPMKIPLISYCRNLTAELESLAEQKGLYLSVVNETGRQELIIEADEALLETAMLNLLNNALKFTNKGGISLILSLHSGEDKIKLTVKDTGLGFSPEEKDRIFQRFTQADEHKDRHHEGTGLGLALTKEIAGRHEWLMDVESSPGIGSSFSLIMPLLTEAVQESPLSDGEYRRSRVASGIMSPVSCEETDYTSKRDSILIVEDNPDMVEILRVLLETRYNLHWCGSGTKALDYLKSNPPVSLIICDIMMPGMSGFSFRRELVKAGTHSEIPFVFLTALADPKDKVQGLKSGALDYIQKPFSSSELLLKIQNLLETHKASYRQALRDSESIERLIRLSTKKESMVNQLIGNQYGITTAEQRIVELVRQGLQDKEIAQALSLSTRTISSHLSNLYRKTDTQNRIELLNKLYPVL
ncbi:MAG: response regulator [Spirochaetales bacterium]|nr:response regulator [Spirochaetales bacterium]